MVQSFSVFLSLDFSGTWIDAEVPRLPPPILVLAPLSLGSGWKEETGRTLFLLKQAYDFNILLSFAASATYTDQPYNAAFYVAGV